MKTVITGLFALCVGANALLAQTSENDILHQDMHYPPVIGRSSTQNIIDNSLREHKLARRADDHTPDQLRHLLNDEPIARPAFGRERFLKKFRVRHTDKEIADSE